MTHYWYFFREMQEPSAESVVYRIKVGTSERDRVKFALVNEFCNDCGLFFKPVSSTSDEAIRNLEISLFPGSNWFVGRLRRVTISIADLYKLIIDDSFIFFERKLAERKGYLSFRSMIDPAFLFNLNRQKNVFTPASPSRKYLKCGSAADLNSFLLNSVVVAIIWLVTAYFESRGW